MSPAAWERPAKTSSARLGHVLVSVQEKKETEREGFNFAQPPPPRSHLGSLWGKSVLERSTSSTQMACPDELPGRQAELCPRPPPLPAPSTEPAGCSRCTPNTESRAHASAGRQAARGVCRGLWPGRPLAPLGPRWGRWGRAAAHRGQGKGGRDASP